MNRLLAPFFVTLSLAIASPALSGERLPLTFEVRVPADDDSDTMGHIYICRSCTPDNWESVVPPEGGMKTRDRLRLTEALLTPQPAPDGVPAALDMSPTIPGAEMLYTGSALSIWPIGYRFSSGVQLRGRILRTTTFVYEAGRVVHELTDPDGGKWILFSVPLSATIHDPAGQGTIDPDEIDAFDQIKGPWWWTYSSRRLDEDLTVSAIGVAEVVLSTWGAAWQQITDDAPADTSIPLEDVLNP